MQKHQVTDTGKALAYIADCCLATVCQMAMKKIRPKGEFGRQIAIAQCAVDWLREGKVDFSSTRVRDVVIRCNGSVNDWAESFIKKEKEPA